MEFPKSFIRASEAYNTFEHHVPAPYLRRAFQVDHEAKANVIITALGFYELYLNGERITKGRLAPYISNPVVVKKSRHEKYLFLICFFKSRHEEYFCRSCFFKSGHGQ